MHAHKAQRDLDVIGPDFLLDQVQRLQGDRFGAFDARAGRGAQAQLQSARHPRVGKISVPKLRPSKAMISAADQPGKRQAPATRSARQLVPQRRVALLKPCESASAGDSPRGRFVTRRKSQIERIGTSVLESR